jgi:hypothetical protein
MTSRAVLASVELVPDASPRSLALSTSPNRGRAPKWQGPAQLLYERPLGSPHPARLPAPPARLEQIMVNPVKRL